MTIAVLALLRHVDQAIHQAGHAIAFKQRESRMERAERVPKRVCAVVMLTRLKPVGLAVHAAVLAIDVVEQRRRHQHVVERGVEDGPRGLIADLDADAAQLHLPLLFGRGAGLLEVPMWHFGLEVRHCVGSADSGNAHAN